MPDSNLPRWGRNVLRGVSTVLYALTALLGILGAVWPPIIEGNGTQVLLAASALALAASGLVCAAATVLHRWRVEFMAVWWVGAALVSYVGIAWSQKPITPVGALFMTATLALSLALLHRGISLAIFAQRTRTERARRAEAA